MSGSDFSLAVQHGHTTTEQFVQKLACIWESDQRPASTCALRAQRATNARTTSEMATGTVPQIERQATQTGRIILNRRTSYQRNRSCLSHRAFPIGQFHIILAT